MYYRPLMGESQRISKGKSNRFDEVVEPRRFGAKPLRERRVNPLEAEVVVASLFVLTRINELYDVGMLKCHERLLLALEEQTYLRR